MDSLREQIARAIYMTHWRLPKEAMPGLSQPAPPVWEDVSAAVRAWVLAQSDAALAAIEASGTHCIMPLKPTEEMREAGISQYRPRSMDLRDYQMVAKIYKAALAARPRYVAPTDKVE